VPSEKATPGNCRERRFPSDAIMFPLLMKSAESE